MRIINTNLPFASADIRFYLKALGKEQTVVTISPNYELKLGPIGSLLDQFYVRKTYQRGMRSLLNGLKLYVENGVDAVSESYQTASTLPL